MTMRSWEIGQHCDQLNKCRERLGDHMSPASDIQRPSGMKRYLFNARVANIKRLEALIAKKMRVDSEKWVKRVYRA